MPAMAVNNQTSTSGPATTGPVGPEDHPERPWTLGDRAHHARGDAKQLRDDHQDDQMAKAPQQQQRQQQPCLEPVEDPPGADGRQRRDTPISPGAWSLDSQLTTVSSATVTSTATSHPTPLVCR
jgi:hypothetical protein